MNKILFIGVLSLLVLGCSKSGDEGVNPDDGNGNNNEALAEAENYYNNTLKPVITANCVSCHTGYHSKNNSSSYGSFSKAESNASGMFNQVNSGSMPKDGAKLAQSEIDKFKEFMDLVNAIK